MSKIVIGQSAGQNISLDIPTFLRTHLLIWASTGGGKSYLIRRLVEQTFGKIPVIIVDREGEFPTLREKYGFVLVGPGGETPADPRSAKLVAEKLLELRASAVCDLFEMKAETRHEWVKNFFEALVNAPKRLWGPTAVILDESHYFVPEKGQGESPAYGAVTDFCSVARKRGFGAILATQRLSKLSKNATAEMYNQAAGPTARQADRDRAAYEMGISGKAEVAEFSNALRTLEAGNFYFQGRAIAMDRVLVHVGKVETTHGADSSGTYTAKAPPTPEKIKALLPKLADLPKEAEEKARTEAELRTEIRSLKAQLRAVPTAPAPRDTQLGEKLNKAVAETREARGQAKTLHGQLARLVAKGNAVAADLKRLAESTAATFGTKLADLPVFENPKMVTVALQLRPERKWVAPRTEFTGDPEDIGSTPKKMLAALAEFEGIGVPKPTRNMVASWCGVKADTGTFKNYISTLRTRNLLTAIDDKLQLTEEGRASTPPAKAVVTTKELFDRAASLFGKTPSAMLKIIHEAHPQSVSRESIASQLGILHDTGTFKNYVSELRSAGMVEDAADRSLKASDWLFVD